MELTLFLTIYCIFTSAAIGFVASSADKFSLASTHIIGGSNVLGSIPYQVSLRTSTVHGNQGNLENPALLEHFCGGSLISHNIVLTAAHCLNEDYTTYLREKMLYVVAGTNFLKPKHETPFVSLVIASSKHPEYVGDKDAAAHDVALLKLKKSAPIDGKKINIISLRTSQVKPDEKCQISGWGTIKYGHSHLSEDLKSATVRIIPPKECQDNYNTSISTHNITSDMICAGLRKGGVDSCQGDSGGPLVCNKELTGVISWGFKCALPNLPGVYASVSYHKEWIKETIPKIDYDNTTIAYDDITTLQTTRNGVIKATACLNPFLVSVVLTKLLLYFFCNLL